MDLSCISEPSRPSDAAKVVVAHLSLQHQIRSCGNFVPTVPYILQLHFTTLLKLLQHPVVGKNGQNVSYGGEVRAFLLGRCTRSKAALLDCCQIRRRT
jgi:hypothetical protein